MSLNGTPEIVRRLDAGLAKVDDLGASVRAICLTETDRKLLDRWWTHAWRRQLRTRARFYPCAFRDHPIRTGKRTLIYTDHGVGIAVPRRMPAA